MDLAVHIHTWGVDFSIILEYLVVMKLTRNQFSILVEGRGALPTAGPFKRGSP